MTYEYWGLKHGPKVEFFFETVTLQDTGSIGNYGPAGCGGKDAEFKFRAIADGSTAEIGETDRWVE